VDRGSVNRDEAIWAASCLRDSRHRIPPRAAVLVNATCFMFARGRAACWGGADYGIYCCLDKTHGGWTGERLARYWRS